MIIDEILRICFNGFSINYFRRTNIVLNYTSTPMIHVSYLTERNGGTQMGLIAISSLMLLGGMYLMIAFAWWLLQIIANWRIFTKAGEAGWKSIIPIYGDYISYKIAWQPAYFWLTLILGIISSYLQGTLEISESLTVYMLVILIKIILVVISIMYSIKLARAFGRGTGFAIGLIFLPPIFMLILGFGDDRYYGADK